MIIDAVVLAGGKSSRLGGVSKAGLFVGGFTLLESTLAAVTSARNTVVVGAADEIRSAAPGAHVVIVREFPVYAGPAAAIAAGVEVQTAASEVSSDFTIVLACDMPGVAAAVDALCRAIRPGSDGVVAVSPDGHIQYLVGAYATAPLAANILAHRSTGDLTDLSVRALLSKLDLDQVVVPEGTTDDIDTRENAAELGITIPSRNAKLEEHR